MADLGAAQRCALPEASHCQWVEEDHPRVYLISGNPDRELGVFTAGLTPLAGVPRITGV